MNKLKQNKKSTNLNKIKSNYILKKIFNDIREKYFLEFIKYNKKTQKRLDININDYIKFSQLYSSIEIEIKITKGEYGEFINFEKEDKQYFHIYFNNYEKEIKRRNKNEITKKDKISQINIIIDYQIKTFERLFNGCDCIEIINFKNIL